MKIHLAMPVFAGVHPNVVQNLISFDIDSQIKRNDLCTQFIRGSILSQNRNFGMRTALEHDDDWMLFWDADVEITDKAFLQGMIETARTNDAVVVGLLVRLKTADAPFNCGVKKGEVYEHIYVPPDIPFETDASGTGVMLINLDWIKKNWPSPPWFHVVDTQTGAFPEDWNFCEQAKGKGAKIMIDPRFNTRHWGEKAY